MSFEALRDLGSRELGLSEAEVLSQRSRYGKNEIVEVSDNPFVELARDTLKDPMIWFLTGIGSVFMLIGDKGEAVILFVAILPLVFMDAILHWRTRASTSSLKGKLTSAIIAIRDGKEVQIDSHDLVPGDLILVNPGLFIPADGIFQQVTELQVDESALTGEAFPITKKISPVDPFLLSDLGETPIDSINLGFAGTRVLTGLGRMRVLRTGQQTSYGEIVQSVSRMPHERTPLQKSISNLVKRLVIASGLLCLVLAGVRIYQGHGWLDAFLSAATLAVAAIPEEFPVVFTFFLGVGVYRLAKRHALVRRAVSVENIGRITQICTDKTGTITVGALKLSHLDPIEGLSEKDLLSTSFAASNPNSPDPVDVALNEAAKSHSLISPIRSRTFPFTEDRKQETVFVLQDEKTTVAFIKGSPETVLARSRLSEEKKTHWKERTTTWARGGHKVLACARKVLNEEEARGAEPNSGYDFHGLLVFEDPARPEVKESIAYCNRNGIRVLMVTGDHQETAVAIAKDVGLGGPFPNAVSAEEEPEKFHEKWLNENPDFLRGLHVVARCTPMQKLRIVMALKKVGEIVAVTGDGINDVPALKAADIGIAMGERGMRSAKEVASIVLTDDNFRTIVGAIKEGQQLFINLQMSFKYLLHIHIPLVLTATVIPLLGYPLLYLPVHIVWLELIIHPSALFAFQQKAIDRDHTRFKLNLYGSDRLLIIMSGLVLTILLGFSFVSGFAESMGVGHGRAKAMVILTLWSAGIVTVFTKLKTWASIWIVGGTLLSSLLLVQVPFFSRALHLTPLHLSDWAHALGWVIALLGVQTFVSQYGLSLQSSTDAYLGRNGRIRTKPE